MKKYEYKVVAYPATQPISAKGWAKLRDDIEEGLNSLGVEGWELVAHSTGMFYFKREIEE